MSALTEQDRVLLDKLTRPCTDCPCDAYRDGLANVLRLHGSGLDHEQLLKLLIEVGRYLAHVTDAPISGESVVGIIGGATADLATDRQPEGNGQTICPTCHGNGTFTPVDGQPGERCPYCPHLYPAGRMATYDEIRTHLDACPGSSVEVVTINAELSEDGTEP